MKIGSAKTKKSWTASLFACILSLLFFVPFFSAESSYAGRTDYASTDTRDGRLAVFDDVWETIDERYYDPTFGGLDWNSPRSVFRQAAAEAKGSRELYEVLRQMIATLNDAHTRVFSPEEKFDWWNPRFVGVGLAIREIGGVATVVQVEPQSAPARAGIRIGDEIESVGGVAAATAVLEKVRTASLLSVSRAARFRAVATLLDGAAGSSVDLSWRSKDGRIRAAAFRRYWNQRQLRVRVRRLEEKYLAIELEAFTQSLTFELVRALKDKLSGIKGIVLDLRGNGGGDADAMAEIAAMFLGDGDSLGQFTDRAGASFQLISHSKSISSIESNEQTHLPLIVLISERTSSAAEILAAVLQNQGRARLIGTSTCGCVLAIRSRHTLPDQGVLDVSEFDYRTPAGLRLEGRGVQPEDLIAPQRQDLYSKRDRALQAALQALKRNGLPVTLSAPRFIPNHLRPRLPHHAMMPALSSKSE